MGFFKKFADMARTNINHLIGQLEDPKKLADQAILDLGANKKKAERLLISVTEALKAADAKRSPLLEKAVALTKKAEDFLRGNNDVSAKSALLEKQRLDQEIQALEQEIDENTKAKDAINRGIKALDDKINSLKSSSTLKASQDAVHNEDAFATFARMEEKIEAKEHEVAALQELIEVFEKHEVEVKAPKKSYDRHSDPDALEKELAAMKRKINE